MHKSSPLVFLAALLFAANLQAQKQGFFLTVGGINAEENGHKIEGKFGTIYTSIDGKTWDESFKGGTVKENFNHANNNMLRCMTYGNGRFVATGNPKSIVTSTDGKSWETITTPRGSMSVEFGNGIFLAPSAGDFMRSDDGLTWEIIKAEQRIPVWGKGGAGHVRKTVFGNGVFVCVGEQRLGVTKDGSSWLHHEILPEAKRPGRNVLLFGKGRFIWLTEKRGVLMSSNGIQWENSKLTGLYSGEGAFGQQGVFDGARFWATAAHWKEKPKVIFRSADGLNWNVAAKTDSIPAFTTAGNGLLLANIGHAKSFRISADGGLNWEEAKVGIGSRKVYFFDGTRIVGQSGG